MFIMNAFLFLVFSVQSKFIELSSFTQIKVGSYNLTTVLKDESSNLELSDGVLVYAFTNPPILLEGAWKKLTKAGVANFTTKINCQGAVNFSVQSYGYTPAVSNAVTIDSSLSSSCRNFKISSNPESPQTNQTTEITLTLFNTSGSPTTACNYSIFEFTGAKLFNYMNLTTNNTLGYFSMIFISPGIKTLYADCLGNFSKKIDINVTGPKIFYINITVFNLDYGEMITTFSALVEVFSEFGVKEINTVFPVNVFSSTSEISGETFKNTSNGEARFDGLSISKLGTFQVSAFSEGVWTAINTPVSVKAYAKISILSDIPQNTTSLFSIKIEMFSDQALLKKITDRSYQANLSLNITKGLIGLKAFKITDGEIVISGLQIVNSGTFFLIVNGKEIHDSYSCPITVLKTKYITVDIIKVQNDIYVYGAITIYDENDVIINSNDVMFYVYTEPYNTVETGLWNSYTMQGKYSFYLTVYCPAVFNLVVFSPGFASGISQTVFKNTTKGCSQLQIQPSATIQETNKTISFNVSLIGSDNKISSGYSLSLADISGSKTLGKTSMINFGNYALMNISFFSSGLKRISFYFNGYYSKIIEILIQGPDIYYLNATISPESPIRPTDVFDFSVDIFKDFNIKSVDKDFNITIYTNPEGNLTGVSKKTSSLGTVLFDSLSILNYGVYWLIAYSEGLVIYICQIEIKVYSKISLLSNEPNSMMSEFSVCVELFTDSEFLDKFYQNKYTVTLSTNKTNSFVGTSTKNLSNGEVHFYGLEIILSGYISLTAKGLGLFSSSPINFFISSTNYLLYSSRLTPGQTINGIISANSPDGKMVPLNPLLNAHFYTEPPSTLISSGWSLLVGKGMLVMSGFLRCAGNYTLIIKSNNIASGILYSLTINENSSCYPIEIVSSHYIQDTNKTITINASIKYDNGTLIPGYNFFIEEASNSAIYGVRKYVGTNGTAQFDITFISPGSKKVLVVYNNYYSKMVEVVIKGEPVQFLNLTFLNKIPGNTTGEFKVKVDILGDRNISYIEKNYNISLELTPDGSLSGPTSIESFGGSSTFQGIYSETAGIYQLVAYSQGCYSSFSKSFTIKGYLKIIVFPIPVIVMQSYTTSVFNVEVILYNDMNLMYPYERNYSDIALYINNTTPLKYFYKSVHEGKVVFYNAQINTNGTFYISASSDLFLNASSEAFTIKNPSYLAIENFNLNNSDFTFDIIPYTEYGDVITSWVTGISIYTNPPSTINYHDHIISISIVDGKYSVSGSICNYGTFQFLASVLDFTSASTNYFTINDTTCNEIIIKTYDDDYFTNISFTLAVAIENAQLKNDDDIKIFDVYESKVYLQKIFASTAQPAPAIFDVTVISPGSKILIISYNNAYSKAINVNVTGPAINYLRFNSTGWREIRIIDAGSKVKFDIVVMTDYGISSLLDDVWISAVLVPDGIIQGTITKPPIGGVAHFEDISVLTNGKYAILAWSENIISTFTSFFEVFFLTKITFSTETVRVIQPLHSQSTFGVLCEIFYDNLFIEKVYTGEYLIRVAFINEHGMVNGLTEGNTTNGEVEFSNLRLNAIGYFTLEASGYYIANYRTNDINVTNCYMKLYVYSDYPMTILSNFSLHIEIYEDLEYASLFTDGSYNISICLSNTSLSFGFQYGLTDNGKLTIDNLKITEEGIYNITASGIGLENEHIYDIIITKLYTKLTFIPGIPNNTEDSFSLEVKVFYDQNMSILCIEGGLILYLNVIPNLESRGKSFKALDGGVAVFNNLKIGTEGTFEFVVEGDEIYPVRSGQFNVVIMNEVNELCIETPGPFMKMDVFYNVKVLLIGYYNTSYTLPANITLKSSNLQFLGPNTQPNINGSATFSIKFISLGTTDLTAFTNKDYHSIKKSSVTIFSIDPLCAYFSSNGKCYECIPNSIIKQDICTCIQNSIYKTDSCICNTGYKLYNNECKQCINRYSSDNITSSYTKDYKGIIINFISSVSNIQNTNCDNLVILPDELKGKIVSCLWSNNKELVLYSNDLLKPIEVVIKVLENIKPYYNECLIENADIVTIVKVPGNFPIPIVEMSGPREYSILCSSENIVIFNKIHNKDYDYNWTISGVKDDEVGAIEEQHGPSLEIGYESLIPGKVEVEIHVLSKNFGTRTVRNFTVDVVDEVKLIVGFNYGYLFKTKASDNIEITAFLLSSCGLSLDPSFSWSYLSSNTLNFTYIQSISPRSNSLFIPSHTLFPNNIYSFQASSLNNQQNISGSGIINIEVISQDLIITLNKWNGPVGIDKDLEIKAYSNDPDNENAEIIITWTCIENSISCLDNNNETLINNYTSPILVVGKNALRNSASYLFIAKAKTLTKEKTTSVEIVVNENIIGDVSIDSTIQKNSNALSFISIVNISYSASFYWELKPNVEGFLLLDVTKPYMKIPDNMLTQGILYTLKLTISSSQHDSITIQSAISRKSLPTCKNVTANEDDFGKILIKTYECSSEYGNLAYQYGVVDWNNSIYWKTGYVYLPYYSIWGLENIGKVVVKICDDFGCDMLFDEISHIRNFRYLKLSDDIENELKNTISIPDTAMHYTNLVKCDEFQYLITYVFYYFSNEYISAGELDLYISCINVLFTRNDCMSSENIHEFVVKTVNLLQNYNGKITESQALSIINAFAYYSYDINFVLLGNLSSLLLNKIVYDWFPGDKAFVYEGNMSLYYYRSFSYELYGENIGLGSMTTVLPTSLDLDYEGIYDIKMLVGLFQDTVYEIVFYKSGTYKNYCLDIKNPIECNDELHDFEVNISSKGLFYEEKMACFTLKDYKTWDDSGCSVNKLGQGNATVRLEYPSIFKLQESSSQECQTSKTPLIIMCLFISFCTILSLGFYFADKNINPYDIVPSLLKIHPLTSLFYKQPYQKRSISTLQILINSLVLLFLIMLSDMLFKGHFSKNSIEHPGKPLESLIPSFIALMLLQIISMPCFILNTLYDKSKKCLFIQYAIWLLSLLFSTIGIITCSFILCSSYAQDWGKEFFIVWPFQFVLEILYSTIIRFFLYKVNRKIPVIDLQDIPSSSSQRIMKSRVSPVHDPEQDRLKDPSIQSEM